MNRTNHHRELSTWIDRNDASRFSPRSSCSWAPVLRPRKAAAQLAVRPAAWAVRRARVARPAAWAERGLRAARPAAWAERGRRAARPAAWAERGLRAARPAAWAERGLR